MSENLLLSVKSFNFLSLFYNNLLAAHSPQYHTHATDSLCSFAYLTQKNKKKNSTERVKLLSALPASLSLCAAQLMRLAFCLCASINLCCLSTFQLLKWQIIDIWVTYAWACADSRQSVYSWRILLQVWSVKREQEKD